MIASSRGIPGAARVSGSGSSSRMRRRRSTSGSGLRGRRPDRLRAPEGRSPGEHRVERGPERVDVRAEVRRSRGDELLRAHVVQRPRRQPAPRDSRVLPSGETEVGEQGDRRGVPRLLDQDVGRLHVPVHQALQVRGMQARARPGGRARPAAPPRDAGRARPASFPPPAGTRCRAGRRASPPRAPSPRADAPPAPAAEPRGGPARRRGVPSPRTSFTATARSSRRSQPRCTSPIPPAPSRLRSSICSSSGREALAHPSSSSAERIRRATSRSSGSG